MRNLILLLFLFPALFHLELEAQSLPAEMEVLLSPMEEKLIEWRRHLHTHAELSNREFNTAIMVKTHLEKLGIEVKDKVAHTGVVGILKGDMDGPVIALRADMDALPVTEKTGLPFASEKKGLLDGKEVDVMHACGHDGHTAILMGVAEILAAYKSNLKGTVVFIFQPAEEGPPAGEEGGANLMVKEGVLKNPDVEAIFGLHIFSHLDVGKIYVREGGIMAGADEFTIKVKGMGAHGAAPHQGVDPIVVASQIVTNLQTIVSRQINLTNEAAVVTVGSIHGGNRFNIIPDEVVMVGTIRALDVEMHKEIRAKVIHMSTKIAEAYGATAEVEIRPLCPITDNNAELMRRVRPSFEKVVGIENVINTKAITGAEDFAFYQEEVPGVYYWIGGRKAEFTKENAPSHHTSEFDFDEACLKTGLRAMLQLVLDY